MTAPTANAHRLILIAAGDDGDGGAVLTELAGGDPGSRVVGVFIAGALTEDACATVESELVRIASTCQRLSLDLSEVSLLSAAGFGLLVRLYQVLDRNHGELRFTALSPAARDVLELLNWNEVSQAVAEVRNP